MSDPHIEVRHSDDNLKDITSFYNCDAGPLAMPSHIRIGQKGTECGGGHDYTIRNYDDQVDEYIIWLGDRIKAGDVAVMAELDTIYNKAIGAGIVLATRCCPQPYITHAHAIKQCIMRLAAGEG
jgi:hypothetical protein